MERLRAGIPLSQHFAVPPGTDGRRGKAVRFGRVTELKKRGQKMIDEKALKEYVREQCIEVEGLRRAFSESKNELEASVRSLKAANYGVLSIDMDVKAVQSLYTRYTERRNTIKLLCCTLGGEYYDIYKRIVGEG